jgi:adenylate cyclase class IV
MEIVLGDDASEVDAVEAKTELFGLLERLGIGRENLEGRYYMDLLREQV